MTGTKLTMNVWETNMSAAVFAVQGEAGSRQLDLTLIEDSGAKGAMSNADVVNKPLDLTGVTVPRLYIVKPDGTKVFSDGKVTDAKNGKASFVLSAQALAVSGKAECQIVLTKANGETLKIIGLVLDIKPSDLDDAVESQDDYEALHEMVALVTQTQQEAAAWLEDANIQFDALLAANSTELGAWLADAANQAQEAIDANDAAFETWFAELREKLSGDVAADLQSQIDTVSRGLSALNASKGKASGLATLNAVGKLAQMPTAADVGAIASTWKPTTARSAMVKADASGNIIAATDGTDYNKLTIKTLWSGFAWQKNAVITTSESMDNYMLLVVVVSNSIGQFSQHWLIMTDLAGLQQCISCPRDPSVYIYISKTFAKQIKIAESTATSSSDVGIKIVYGIK